MIQDASFERVRREVSRDLRAVRPLRPAWQGALVALPIALLLASLVLLVYGLRGDADMEMWAVWAPPSFMVGAAYLILVLALIQRAPESTVSWIWWALLPVLAMGLQVGGAYLTLQHGELVASSNWRNEAVCFWRISLLGIPPVLLALALVSRGLPLRPKVAGLLGGVAGGLISEGVYRLHCPMSHPAHIIPWHTGAILVMGLLGALGGLWWERRRLKKWMERHP